MKRYSTIPEMCAAFAEYDASVHRVKSQDPARPIVQATKQAITVPPNYDHWQDIKRVFALARRRTCARMPDWIFDLWLDNRVNTISVRTLSKRHNATHEEKIGKSALNNRFLTIDQIVEQAMADMNMCRVNNDPTRQPVEAWA
jgi:hypothetical protein